MTKTAKHQIIIYVIQTDVDARFQPFWAASSHAGLLRVEYGISRDAFVKSVSRQHPRAEIIFSHAPLTALTQIAKYLNGHRTSFSLTLDLSSFTPFQHQVYQAVRQIPYGETRTYGQIARLIGRPNAARAVGAANGANPIPIIIPCHRLIGADGSLRGYGGLGGLKTKQYLLDLEQKNLTNYPA